MKTITTWKTLSLTILIAILLLPALTARAVWAQTAAGASTPEQAVTILLEPFYNPAAGTGACNAVSGQLAACPITARLRTRLEQATENGNIVSRSQNPAHHVVIGPIKSDGQIAHVPTAWDYSSSSYSITFTVVKQENGWLVDDSFCSAQPASSIYNPPTGPCPLDLRGEPVPGMPNTGAQGFPAFGLLAMLGALLMVGAGLLLLVAGNRGHGSGTDK
jgi:hypothetical protein